VVALSEILQRFRFHGVPGAAAPAGVPVDRTKDIQEELAPVFAALDEVQRRASELVADAARDAAVRHATSLEEADRILAAARTGAVAERADAAAQRLAVAQQERERLVSAGREEAARIERVAEERMPAVVAATVEQALAPLLRPGNRQTGAASGADRRGRVP
jgi:cell division septum initiation protein DivIVA